MAFFWFVVIVALVGLVVATWVGRRRRAQMAADLLARPGAAGEFQSRMNTHLEWRGGLGDPSGGE